LFVVLFVGLWNVGLQRTRTPARALIMTAKI
jgi:hypothetical protein